MSQSAPTTPPSAPIEWIWRRAGKVRWQINAAFASDSLVRRLGQPGQLTAPPAEPLRQEERPRETFLVRVRWAEHPVSLVIKRFNNRGPVRSFKTLVRPSRARRAFERACFLLEHGIATAVPVAAGDVRCCGLIRESYLITEEVAGQQLRQWRKDRSDAHPGRKLVRALADTMARLHNLDLSHTDPTLSNFLVSASDSAVRMILVDLDGIRPCRHMDMEIALRNLCRLLSRIKMSPREQLWFAAQYCRNRQPRLSARDLLPELKPAK